MNRFGENYNPDYSDITERDILDKTYPTTLDYAPRSALGEYEVRFSENRLREGFTPFVVVLHVLTEHNKPATDWFEFETLKEVADFIYTL